MSRTARAALAAALLLSLAGCLDNDALGNDRRAELDPPEPPAERAPAASLVDVEPGLLKPAPMTKVDLASLSGVADECRFRYTAVGFPVFLYPPDGDGPAMVKLNGRLIELAPAGDFRFAGGPVRAEMRHPDGVPLEGEEEAVLIIRLDGAPDELGFLGVAQCG